jgi:DNA polymerase elongation subunit (family B)
MAKGTGHVQVERRLMSADVQPRIKLINPYTHTHGTARLMKRKKLTEKCTELESMTLQPPLEYALTTVAVRVLEGAVLDERTLLRRSWHRDTPLS